MFSCQFNLLSNYCDLFNLVFKKNLILPKFEFMTNYSFTSFLYMLLVYNSFLFSQTQQLNKEYYKAFDSLNNYQNIEVFNGLEYIDNYFDFERGNHKFYHDENTLVGDVIFNGQPYFGFKMKYELLSDFLVVEFTNQKLNYVILDSERVEEFVLDNDKFIRLPNKNELKGFYKNGFFKEVYKKNNYSLYVKYIKTMNDKIRDDKVFYVFSEKKFYVLSYQDKLYRINKLKDVVNVLPLKKNQIQKFYRNYKKLYKINREKFFENLLESIDNQVVSNVSE